MTRRRTEVVVNTGIRFSNLHQSPPENGRLSTRAASYTMELQETCGRVTGILVHIASVDFNEGGRRCTTG